MLLPVLCRNGQLSAANAQPVLAEAVDYFFGDTARVPASTNLHDRMMDLLLTALSFSLDDPGACQPLHSREVCHGACMRASHVMRNDLRSRCHALLHFIGKPGAFPVPPGP